MACKYINILLQEKPVVFSLQPESDVAVGVIVCVEAVVNVAQRTKDVVVHQVEGVRVGMIVTVEAVVNVAQRRKDVVVHQVESVCVGIPVIVPLTVDVEVVVENPKNNSNSLF
jgi:hypothetical protein